MESSLRRRGTLSISLEEVEEGNKHNHFAMCEREEIIGHVPRELSKEVWHFLRCKVHVKLSEEENKETDWRCRVGTAL